MAKKFFIFSDASFDPKSKAGIAGILLLSDVVDVVHYPGELPIQLKKIQQTTCTRLEMESVIWALESVRKLHKQNGKSKIDLYTDCKTAVDLPQRRLNLEAKNFLSKKTTNSLSNADLYKKFFQLCDLLNPQLIWTKGHIPSHAQNDIQHLFSEVDKATRRELRKML